MGWQNMQEGARTGAAGQRPPNMRGVRAPGHPLFFYDHVERNVSAGPVVRDRPHAQHVQPHDTSTGTASCAGNNREDRHSKGNGCRPRTTDRGEKKRCPPQARTGMGAPQRIKTPHESGEGEEERACCQVKEERKKKKSTQRKKSHCNANSRRLLRAWRHPSPRRTPTAPLTRS